MAHRLLTTVVVLWLAAAEPTPGEDVVEQLKGQLEALAAFTADLDRRLSEAGVSGIEGALDLHRRITAALEAVTITDLDRVRTDVDALTTLLGDIAARLATLRRLKQSFG